MSTRRLRRVVTAIRSLPNSLRFNFAYFAPAQAVRLPVIVSHKVWLDRLDGSVDVIGEMRTGMIRIGFGEVRIFDRQRSRSIWSVEGRVVFEGGAILGHGTRIAVDRAGTVVFGSDFCITAELSIECRKEISFGSGVLISWDVLIMDSDWHSVVDGSGTRLNPDQPVEIGNHVWIGCRSTILKGSRLADGSIVAAGSVVTGQFPSPNSLVAGVPAGQARTGVTWSPDLF